MLALYFALLAILVTGSLAVFNGELAAPHQFPYHVSIYWVISKQIHTEPSYRCQGSLISDRWVLASGVCVDYFEPYIVKAGKHIRNQEEESEQVRSVVHYIVHPEFKGANKSKNRPFAHNDIAIIKVDTPFVFNEYVSAAMLPSANASFQFGFLAGWGSINMEPVEFKDDNRLYYNENLKVLDPQNCIKAFNEANVGFNVTSSNINSNHTCSEGEGKKTGGKPGDGGIAFVSQENNTYVVIGIVSGNSVPPVVVRHPTVYTRVGAYLDWINKAMESS